MSLRHAFTLAAMLALPALASAAPVVINFDDLASGTVLTNQYAALGVTFSATEDGNAVGSVVTAFTNNTNPNVWSNCFNGFCADRADVVRMDFTSGASAVQFWVDTAGSLSPVFNAYDGLGNLLESIVAPATGQGNFTLLQFAATGISYIEGLQPEDSWAYLIDTLQFEPGTVPEPATLPLIGLAFAGVAAARRRKS